MNFTLLPPRPAAGPLRTLSTAKAWCEKIDRQEIWRIQHAWLPVTPAEIVWWFSHLDTRLEVEGQPTTHYLLWHPIEHIHWEEKATGHEGKRGAGGRWQIVESLAGKVQVVDAHIHKFDETGLILDAHLGPFVLGRLEHRWWPVNGGTFYDTALTLNPANSPFMSVARMIATEFDAKAWLTHNVEEVGLIEHLVPKYARPAMAK